MTQSSVTTALANLGAPAELSALASGEAWSSGMGPTLAVHSPIDGQVIKNGWIWDLGRSRLGEAQKATAPAKFSSRMLSEIESRLNRQAGFGMMWLNELKS